MWHEQMKILNYLIYNRGIKNAELRFERYYVSGRNSFRGKSIEELDNIPTTMEGKVQDNLETVVRMLMLADAYWDLYRQHYGSEGASRGQELQHQAYFLLCRELGPWSSRTIMALEYLSRWEFSPTERGRILNSVLVHCDLKKLKPKDPVLYTGLLENMVWWCLRTDDYGDYTKALELLYMDMRSLVKRNQTVIAPKWSDSRLFAIHAGRQEWDEAENLAKQYLKQSFADEQAVVYANLGEAQIRLGKLEDAEEALREGMAVEKGFYPWTGYLLCCEQLLDLYLQQGNWNSAEVIGLQVINIREDHLLKEFGQQLQFRSHPTKDWDQATQKAARVIKMNWWTAVGWGDDEKVCFLHGLYNDKRQLALVYMQQKRYDEAEQLLKELMKGKMHRKNPVLIATKKLLTAVYIESGQLEEAEKLQEKIIEEMTTDYGHSSDNLIPALNKLASIREIAVNFYLKSKQLDQAENMQEKIVQEMTKRFGYDSEELIPALEKLADICQRNEHLGKRHHVKLRLLRYL
ncbi:hypothetical protein CPB83DRAFT_886153 [Crepidotus variabilis]|uniref:MalT-like TPR region domain-containing protein n=1 Tax=Crepidotus variabilis TaxID=179855 RepID=A0A9P6E8Q5_9AGAR|nr:hypothetical protein CPB83DRAFT_886153 [Crepidotus variabilis]